MNSGDRRVVLTTGGRQSLDLKLIRATPSVRVGVIEMGRKARGGLAACVALALACSAVIARADVLVDGDEAAVRVVASQASVAEVFAALQSKFRFRHNLAINPERRLSGTIAGPLHQVVARLLDGYDFVVKRAPDGVEVVRVAPRGTASWTPAARPGVTVWQVPSAQAMRPTPKPE